MADCITQQGSGFFFSQSQPSPACQTQTPQRGLAVSKAGAVSEHQTTAGGEGEAALAMEPPEDHHRQWRIIVGSSQGSPWALGYMEQDWPPTYHKVCSARCPQPALFDTEPPLPSPAQPCVWAVRAPGAFWWPHGQLCPQSPIPCAATPAVAGQQPQHTINHCSHTVPPTPRAS